MEIWKDIPGFENYSISTYGNIKSTRCKKDKSHVLLKLKPRTDGYVTVGLIKEGKRFYLQVHRLVALTFIPNPEMKDTVNHIDRNRSNNRISNLEWATRKEQIAHIEKRWATGVRTIWRINKNTNEKIHQHKSLTSASLWILNNPGNDRRKTTNISSIKCQISAAAINGSHHLSAYGYRWKYATIDPIDGETWETISDTNKKISNYARVTDSKNRLLKPTKTSGGYLAININGVPRLLHRLVATAFLENPYNKPHVNHLDGDKTNNHASNLQFTTALENNIHAVAIGLRG